MLTKIEEMHQDLLLDEIDTLQKEQSNSLYAKPCLANNCTGGSLEDLRKFGELHCKIEHRLSVLHAGPKAWHDYFKEVRI